MQKNIAGQKWYIKAWDETDNTVKAGDAANITANLRLDGGAANATDDVNPTELENGYYVFDITQAESNADYILICPSSATINIQVEGCPKAFTTTPPNYNVLGIETDGDLTKVNTLDGHTVQTGDSYPVVSHADHGNAKLVRSTTPANKLDVSATGEAGLDFDNIKNASGAHTLANITVPVCTFNTDMRGTDNAAIASVWSLDRSDDLVEVKAQTDQIQFDGSGNVQTSISRPTGTVVANAGNSASIFATDLTETADDYWLNAWVKFTSGNLVNQVRKVQGYNGTTKMLLFYSSYTETPANGDDFELIVE